MAYIGNRPVSGDNNSFRVLDDIKTHTFSFDGSSSSVVSTSDNTITHIGHRLIQGQRVTYTDGTGSAIGGLTDGTVYFVIINDANSFKLASSASNAAAGTAINLTSVGSGTSHNINVAFDGVNTKFKATFNNGTEADVTRVAQIQISLDNVIQQPQNTATPTSGFGFESDSVIVFATAPASNATFWGILFANNFPTFEISDNDVDNFTGDGSKTEFSLSKSPASNENIIVTIDGVVQYPSDNSTTRAYNTVGNALQFSSAPANGADIQARHIGFAGPDESGGVTAFYGRTGSVFLNNSDNIVVNNAEVAGNLTVQGTMTTLDTKVTEVDQLEVAANNSTVGVAITQSGSGDILKLYDSSTPVFVVKENGKVGIGTDNPNAQLDIEGEFARIDLHDYDGNQSQIIQSGGALFLNLDSEGNGNGALRIRSGGNSGVNEIIRIKPDGTVGIGSTTPTEKLDVIGNIKSSGTITASSFVGGLPITNGADNRVITATSASAIQGEAGLTFDGTTLSNAGTGFKGITIAPSTNNSATLRLQNSVKNFSVSNVTGGKFAIADGSTQRFIIDGSGNVGVGTNSITTRFEIEGTAALTNHNQTLIIRDSVSDDAPGRGGNIGFGAYVNGTMRTLAAIGAFKKNSGTGFDGHLALYTRRNGIGPVDEVMRLESGGDVGIGTTNPVGKLHLFAETGDCVLTLEADRGNSNSNENDNPYIVFRQDGSTQNSAIGMNPNGITGESNSLVLVNGASSGGIIFKTGSGGNFTSGTSEKMRILPDGEIRISDGGKITINTSVSGNYALQEALRVDDGNFTNDRALQIFEYHNNGVRWHSFNQNLDVTTTGTSYTYTQGNYGGSNMIEMNQGDLKIYNNPEVVSAGTSAITPTERIRVRSDGKVLIGSDLNATPYDDRKLTINSTSNNYLSIQSGDSSFSGIVFGHNSGQSTDNFLTYVRHNNVDNAFAIHTNSASTPKVIITSDGSVGIGTNNPTQKLEVKYGEAWIDNSSGDGTARSDGLTVSHAPNSDFTVGADPTDNKRAATFAVKGSSRAAIVTLRNIDDSNAFWDFIADGNTNKFYIQRGTNNGAALGPAVTIDTDLNVGIGTDDPKTKLNVYTHPHSDTGGILVQNANYTSNLNKAYLIAGTQTWTGATTDWSTYGFQHKLKTDSGGVPRLTIDTSGGGGSIKEIITFMTSGNVGIGSVADEKLHVVVSSSTATAAKFERSHNNNVAIEYRNTTSRMYAGLAGDALGWAVDNDANLGNLPMFMVRRTTGFVGVGVVEPLRKLDVIGSGSDGISILARPTTLNIDSSGNADSVNNSIIIRMPYGENPSTTANAGARFGIQFTGANNTTDISSLNWGDDPVKSASIYGVSEDSGAGFSRKVGLAFYTSNFDIAQRERLRIKSDGNVGIGTVNPTSLLTVGARPKTTTANATVLISPASGNASIQLRGGSPILEFDGTGGGNGQIFTDSADLTISNGTIDGAGTELVRITAGGEIGIGVDPTAGDLTTGDSQNTPVVHVKGSGGSATGGEYNLLGRFEAGGDANSTGAMIVLNHSNDRGIALIGGREIENRAYGAIKVIDNQGRLSDGIIIEGGNGAGIGTMKFFTGEAATTTERLRIDSDGNIGIATVSPAHKLDILGDAAIEGTLFLSDVGGQIVKFDGTGGNLDVYSDGTIDFIESDNNKTMVTFDINTVHDDARIYLEGDIDTYLNHPNSNQLGFTIGGSDTMRLKASQVGIGTVNPTSLLHLMGGDCRLRWSKSDAGADLKNWDFSAQGEIFRIQAKNDADSGGGNIFDFHRTTNQINEFRGVQSGNTWFVVDNLNREVGIRTDNPAAPLHVETAVNQSTIAIFGSTNTTSGATYQALLIRNDVTGYPALCNASSSDVLDVRSAGSVQVTIDDNNNDTAKFFRVMVNGLGNAGTEVFKVNETGLTTLKNFNGTGLKLEGANSDYQGIQLQVTDASASQTRNIFIDTVNETGAAVANQVGQIQSDGGSHWSWSTQPTGDRTDRRVERVRIKADGKIGISSISSTGTAVVEYESGSSLPPNAVGGITVKVGDEQISNEIQLPRNGHIMVITGFSDTGGTSFPQPQASGMMYVDVGISTNIRSMYTQSGIGSDATTNVGNDLVSRNTHTNTVSDCANGRITIMPGTSTGTIRICNREADSAYIFYLTFL